MLCAIVVGCLPSNLKIIRRIGSSFQKYRSESGWKPPVKSHAGHLHGGQPYLGDLLTMVTNHLLSGVSLKVRVDGLHSLKQTAHHLK